MQRIWAPPVSRVTIALMVKPLRNASKIIFHPILVLQKTTTRDRVTRLTSFFRFFWRRVKMETNTGRIFFPKTCTTSEFRSHHTGKIAPTLFWILRKNPKWQPPVNPNISKPRCTGGIVRKAPKFLPEENQEVFPSAVFLADEENRRPLKFNPENALENLFRA